MKKFKFIHVSDLHLGLETYGTTDARTGLNSRTLDILQALDQTINFAIQNDIKLIVASGDIFNSKLVSNNVINAWYERVKRISDNDIDLFVLSGNHDKSKILTNKCALDLSNTLQLKNVYSTDGLEEPLDLGYVQIYSPSYWWDLETLEEKINIAAKKIDFTRPSILVCHLQTETPEYKHKAFMEDLKTVPLSLLISHPWQYVALGHLHKPQPLHESPLVCYAGSLVNCSFNEEGDNKGFNVITVDGIKPVIPERIEVDCVGLKTLRGTPADIRVQLDKRDSYVNHIVRLIIDDSQEPIDESYLKSKLSDSFKYVIQKEKIQKKFDKISTNQTFNPGEFLNLYFEKDKQKEELLELAKEIMI